MISYLLPKLRDSRPKRKIQYVWQEEWCADIWHDSCRYDTPISAMLTNIGCGRTNVLWRLITAFRSSRTQPNNFFRFKLKTAAISFKLSLIGDVSQLNYLPKCESSESPDSERHNMFAMNSASPCIYRLNPMPTLVHSITASFRENIFESTLLNWAHL